MYLASSILGLPTLSLLILIAIKTLSNALNKEEELNLRKTLCKI